MTIVDIHTHPIRSLESVVCSPEKAAEAQLKHMDRSRIRISGLLGHDVACFQDAASIRQVNQFTQEVVAFMPDRFFGLCFVNPALPKFEVIAELDRCLETPYFRGIKLELDVNCRSALLDIVMEKAVQYDVPVLHHSWYVNAWTVEGDATQAQRSEPHDIADLAKRHPNVRIIMAHMEGSNVRGILDVAGLPNVWIDTSGSQPFSGTLEFAVERLGSERILFGSDMFLRGLASQLGRVLSTPLAQKDQDNILYRNAVELFRLEANGSGAFL